MLTTFSKIKVKNSVTNPLYKPCTNAINSSASYLGNKKIAGVLFAPIIPITVQSSLVIIVNVINETPNLALTVAPSIFFTALYAYTYMLALLKKIER